MFEMIHATTHKISAKIPQSSAAILVLALLSGYATIAAAQTEPPAAAPTVCNSDTDDFCVEGDKDKGARLHRQALEYMDRQDYDQALDFFKQAIEVDDSNPEYYYHLGVTYSFKGTLEEAEAAYMAVLAIGPLDPKLNRALANTYFNLACLYALQGKKDQAFEQLEILFTVDPNTIYHYVRSDKDLDSLRDDPRYKELLARRPGNSSASGEAKTPDETGKPQQASKPKKTAKPKKPTKPGTPVK